MNSENAPEESVDREATKPPLFYRSWFINRFDHLRALWRITLLLIITVLLAIAIGWILKRIPYPDEGDALITWKEFGKRGATLIAMILAAFITLRWIDRRPITLLGLGLLDGWKRDFAIGLIIGMGTISVTLAVLWAGGWVTLSLNELTLALLGALTKALLLFFVAALMEELLLRGYIFQAFIEGSRVWIALILLSLLFSVAHLNNPDSTIPSSLNIFLA